MTRCRRPSCVLIALICLALAACSGPPAGEAPAPPAAEPQRSIPVRPPGEDTATDSEGPIVFSADAVRPGDTVAGLTVAKVESAPPSGAVVSFSGEVAVTGTYVHHPEHEHNIGGEVCLHELDAASQARLPRLRGDERVLWLCLANRHEARRALAPAGVGAVTVVVDGYTIVKRETDEWNHARLVRVAEVRNAQPWTRPVTLRIEGMEETRTYRLLYLPILPFTTYTPSDWTAEAILEGETVGVRLRASGRRTGSAPLDVGFLEVVFLPPRTSRERAEAAVAERLGAYAESAAVEPPPWALAAWHAANRADSAATSWLAQRGDRYFYVLSHLERLESGDARTPTVDAVLEEWRWRDTGEPLGG